MIYWYTGQPGHGKTLHALDHALRLRDEGRLVYVCNVRALNYAKSGLLELTPEQFKDWENSTPEGCVIVVDEAYEHGMLTKRPPGSKVPRHVEQLAKHRHTGRDFIFVSQSPAKQVDEFVHDLIEQQIHVRRRFGLPFAHLRIFDRYERNPEKGSPLILKRVKLPKRPMGLYESTVLDTTERNIPWYYIAAIILVPALAYGAYYNVTNVRDKLKGQSQEQATGTASKTATEDGAVATAEGAGAAAKPADLRTTDYAAWLTPRIGGQPWTAPAYDKLAVPAQPPRLFCMASGDNGDESCTCLTEQGTRYVVEHKRCRMIANDGQYEPFRDENLGDRMRLDETTQRRQLAEYSEQHRQASSGANVPMATGFGSVLAAPQAPAYGDHKIPTEPGGV